MDARIDVVNSKSLQHRTVIRLGDQIVVISGRGTPGVVYNLGWIGEDLH